jgi:hypothetical protein
MNSKITKVSVVFLILFLVQDIGYSQNNNSKEYLKINVNVKHDEYSCSNPGCKNLIYKKSMTQINSINNENGGSFCVLPSLALLDLSYITAEANAKKYSKCNNTNFRNCNYNLISTLLEIATEYYTSEEDCQGLIDNPSFYGLNSNVYYITPAILLEQFFKRNTENSKKFKELYEREKIEDSIKKEQKLQKELLLQTFTKNLYEKKYYEADTILSFLINNNPFFNNQELGGFYYRWKAAWSNDLDKYLDLNDLENISKLISVFENKKIKITTSGYSYEREEEEKMLKYHKSTTIPFMQKLKELKSKELTPLEISFVGRWQFLKYTK